MGAITVKVANKSNGVVLDIQGIVSIQKEWSTEPENADARAGFLATVFSQSEIIGFYENGANFHCLAIDGEFCGFALVTSMDYFTEQVSCAESFIASENIEFTGKVYLYQLAIKKRFVKCGMGKLLLASVFESYSHTSIVGDILIKPVANSLSIRFFETQGFRKIGELNLNQYRDFGALVSAVYLCDKHLKAR